MILPYIRYSEIEPLRHALIQGGEVRSQLQVVDEFADLGSSAKVTAFKARFENQSVIALASW